VTSTCGRLTGKIMIVAASALLLAGVAAAKPTAKVIGTGYIYPNSGGKLSFGQGQTVAPINALSVKLVNKPAQKVRLAWTVTCSKGKGGIGEDVVDPTTTQKSGQKSVTSPATVNLPLPYAHPKTCSVSIYAYLTKQDLKTKLQILRT
jgi:hypothetical protein